MHDTVGESVPRDKAQKHESGALHDTVGESVPGAIRTRGASPLRDYRRCDLGSASQFRKGDAPHVRMALGTDSLTVSCKRPVREYRMGIRPCGSSDARSTSLT